MEITERAGIPGSRIAPRRSPVRVRLAPSENGPANAGSFDYSAGNTRKRVATGWQRSTFHSAPLLLAPIPVAVTG
jgi:hypothetical protein